MDVRDWLNTYKSLPQSKLDEYAKQYQNDDEYILKVANNIIQDIRDSDTNISSITSQLSSFLKSRSAKITSFLFYTKFDALNVFCAASYIPF